MVEKFDRRATIDNMYHRINKASYTATQVACGWAGAVFENTVKVFGQGLYLKKA